MIVANSTTRFTDRVDDYVNFRPSYPASLIEYLKKSADLAPTSQVADVGSGSGIFTRLLLSTGATVWAVEPNLAMRQAAEAALLREKNFRSVLGTAESTSLATASLSLVTVAQAFHWFDPLKTREEFLRILKPGGQVALIWNTARTEATPFLGRYRELQMEFGGEDYRNITEHSRNELSHIAQFYGAGEYTREVFANYQDLNLRGLQGRFFSASYAPKKDSKNFPAAQKALEKAFGDFQQEGLVRMDYDTEIYLGRL